MVYSLCMCCLFPILHGAIKMSIKFKKKEYWDSRYKNEESFDWFCDLRSFGHLLFEHVKKTDRILILGCGNSNLSESLFNMGYTRIDNIDFSPVVIEKMTKRTNNMTPATNTKCLNSASERSTGADPAATDSDDSMKWHVMDMMDLKFNSSGFDVVLDKGSLDSLMVDQGDVWDPCKAVREQVEKALSEAYRVLKDGGCFISITFSQPHFRGKLLYQRQKFDWTLRHWTFGDSFHYFFYVATKNSSCNPSNKDRSCKSESSVEFDYSFPHLYSSSTAQQTPIVCSFTDDDGFLLGIGDIFS